MLDLDAFFDSLLAMAGFDDVAEMYVAVKSADEICFSTLVGKSGIEDIRDLV